MKEPVPSRPQTEQQRIEYTPLNELKKWPKNPKDHDLGAIQASVNRFGYVSPILVDEKSGRIVAGHGRLDLLVQMKHNGHAPPERVKIAEDGEWLVPVIRGISFANEHEAEAYLMADNQTTILGGWNDSDLFEMLRRQAAADSLFGTGFDAEDVEDLRRRFEAETGIGQENAFTVYPAGVIGECIFEYFRRTGFPYRNLPLHTQMLEINRLAALEGDALLTSDYGYRVADTYHPHRFDCHAADKRSPADSFADDNQLRRAIRLALENGTMITTEFFPMLGFVAGTQACSNFRPGIATYYYRRFTPENGVVLDPCTGYGGRLIGWIASRLGGQYVGVDPSTETHRANLKMAAALAAHDSVTLINQPFEDADLGNLEADFIFTSPPYFMKEAYTDEPTQSALRYQTFETWREGFLVPLMEKCYAVLKPGHRCIINIADIKIRNRMFHLAQAALEAGVAVGFEHEVTEHIRFGTHFGQGSFDESAQSGEDDEVKQEPVFVFRKTR